MTDSGEPDLPPAPRPMLRPTMSVNKMFECGICFEMMMGIHEPITISCGHTSCHECLQRHFSDHDSCPVCRRMIPLSDREDLKCNIVLRDAIERVYPEQVEAAAAERAAAELEAAARPKNIRSDEDIYVAVNMWCGNRVAAEQKYGHISNWDVSSVTNMKDLFKRKADFNDNINSWDTSQVTDMRSMFYEASAFNQPVNSWNTSQVTDMRSMFMEANAFNQPVNSWNTSHVTGMDWMFNGASAFNQPVNSWNTSHVTDMNGMFWRASAFNQPVNSWDTSQVTTMSCMFYRASVFNQPVDSWDTSHVTDMNCMFYFYVFYRIPLEFLFLNFYFFLILFVAFTKGVFDVGFFKWGVESGETIKILLDSLVTWCVLFLFYYQASRLGIRYQDIHSFKALISNTMEFLLKLKNREWRKIEGNDVLNFIKLMNGIGSALYVNFLWWGCVGDTFTKGNSIGWIPVYQVFCFGVFYYIAAINKIIMYLMKHVRKLMKYKDE